ncbi:MAG: DUF6382 domain-containing protein [Lachnospiraceae bacterium]|jgi:hypothetical protein|nr:DUF6382 domain-containing protein [Lachnospiraceae bacterium]MEE3460424.1 DUF6382 domain-containing protein [Lachnospiraceae bacterium]
MNDKKTDELYLSSTNIDDMLRSADHEISIRLKEGTENHGDVLMLINNDIAGILPARFLYIDEDIYLLYDRAGFESLSSVIISGREEEKTIPDIIKSVLETYKCAENYFLDPDNFIISPDYIFWNSRKHEAGLIYYPESAQHDDRCPGQGLKDFMELLLENVSASDRKLQIFMNDIYNKIANSIHDGLRPDIDDILKITDMFGCDTDKDAAVKGADTFSAGRYPYPGDDRSLPYNETEKTGGSRSAEKNSDHDKFFLKSVNMFMSPDIEITDEEKTIIGRSAACIHSRIPNVNVSRRHAVIHRSAAGFFITDEGSLNGTYVNEKRILSGKARKLKTGDRVRFSNVSFTFENVPAA